MAFEGLPLRKEFHRPSYEQETEQAIERKQGPEAPLLKPTRTSLQQFLISQQSTDETEDSYASADEVPHALTDTCPFFFKFIYLFF